MFFDDLAARTDGYTGADVEAVCREAATIAVREFVHRRRDAERADAASPDVEDIVLAMDHFEQALEMVDAALDTGTDDEQQDLDEIAGPA